MTLGTSWSFKPNDTYKSAGEVIQLLVDVVAKGGNLLLNIGPDAQGRFADEAVDRLRAIGAWMRVNGEAIHRSRPVTTPTQDTIRFTRRGHRAQFCRFPEQRFAVLVLCNLQESDPPALAQRVADLHLAEAFTEPAPVQPARAPSPLGRGLG